MSVASVEVSSDIVVYLHVGHLPSFITVYGIGALTAVSTHMILAAQMFKCKDTKVVIGVSQHTKLLNLVIYLCLHLIQAPCKAPGSTAST